MKKHIVIAGIVFTALTASFISAPLQIAFAKQNEKSENLALKGTLEGFKPGAHVSYRVFPEQGQPMDGEAFIDAQGHLEIPGYNLFNAAGKYLGYNIHVDEGAAPLDFTMTFNSESGKIAVRSQGLKEFSDIGFTNSKSDTMTKADWAGLLQSPDAGDLNAVGEEGGFKVALYDNNIMSDVTKQNPKIIQVLAASGGGGPTSGGVNQYTTPYGCNDGISPGPDYSFCNSGSMKTQTNNIVENFVRPMIMMTEQLSAVMHLQVLTVGAMFDAKHQLESQRDFQKLTAEAHKDYQPSELMCDFGSFMKGMTTADQKASYEKMAINDILVGHYTDKGDTESSEGMVSDIASRVKQFREVYCDPQDNNSGLHYICDHDQTGPGTIEGATDKARINKDINYASTLDQPLTLDVDFAYAATTPPNARAATADEEDIIALAKNLYWPAALDPGQGKDLQKNWSKYMDSRQLYTMSNVAHDSFASLAGLKSKTGPTRDATGKVILGGANYMQSLMRNFGLSDTDITAMLGENPSYYAQMDVLTKKIYQQPDFYTNLYDKPTNVKRINVTLQAINNMQQRDFFESALRREMLTSLMVEEALAKHVADLNGRTVSDIRNLQRK